MDPWILNVVKTGFAIKFWQPLLLSMVPNVQSGSSNQHKNARLEMEFHKLLKKGAIEVPEAISIPQTQQQMETSH